MEDIDKYYLLFTETYFHFLIPLSWVDHIADGRADQGKENILSISLQRFITAQSGYKICLKEEKNSFDISAEGVLGVRHVEDSECIRLKKPVINAGNTYLKAIVMLKENGDCRIPAFILDMEILSKKEALWNI